MVHTISVVCDVAHTDFPRAIEKILSLLESNQLREDQIHVAAVLRTTDKGTFVEQRTRYFNWHLKDRSSPNEPTDCHFVDPVCRETNATLTPEEASALTDMLRTFSIKPKQISQIELEIK